MSLISISHLLRITRKRRNLWIKIAIVGNRSKQRDFHYKISKKKNLRRQTIKENNTGKNKKKSSYGRKIYFHRLISSRLRCFMTLSTFFLLFSSPSYQHYFSMFLSDNKSYRKVLVMTRFLLIQALSSWEIPRW